MFEKIKSEVRDAIQGVATKAESTLNETTIRLAITGLSRAGKTVFITSMIHNLLALGNGRDTLPKLQACLDVNGITRLRNIRILPAGTGTTPYFDFEAKLKDLASDVPSWPPRTDDLSEIGLTMEIDRRNGLLKKLGTRRVRLEILDYPGEWLLDLPLLSKTYAQWSHDTMHRLRQPPQDKACEPFLEFLNGMKGKMPADDTLIRRGHMLYREGLEECRTKYGLRYLQPGRFLCPGPRADAPFLWFFPLDDAEDHPASGTTDALMRDRFEKYKADMKASFFDTYFTKFDRQILLVDVLGALHAGREAFEDTEQAIADIVSNLAYGMNVPRPVAEIGGAAIRIGGAVFSPTVHVAKMVSDVAAATSSRRIERLAIVATKSDQVPSMRRDNLKNLVRAITETALIEKNGGRRPISYHVVSAVHSTTDSTTQIEGRTVEVVLALLLNEDVARKIYAGDVPSGRPPANFWADAYFALPVFAPPRLNPSGAEGIPHLGMDGVLADLLGDVL
jgi:predicted YcjX-like family ATPase